MNWLTPEEEGLVRRLRAGPGSFSKEEMPTLDKILARGLVSETRKLCPNCGFHYVRSIEFTERGKVACLILDYLYRKPVT